MPIVLCGLGTATPLLYATQEEACEIFTGHMNLKTDQKDLYRRILLNGKIKGRYLGLERAADILDNDPDRLLGRFLKYGRAVAAGAAQRALAEAGVQAADIGGLIVNTCTGYLCPGLSSYLAADLGLKTAIRVLDLMGMGCGGALPNLDAAAGMLAHGKNGPVLSIAVEICSATIFPDHEPELILSNSIFGDGAAAAILDTLPEDHTGALARYVDFAACLSPRYREDLRYRTVNGRLRNQLSRRVPVIAGRVVAEMASDLLARNGLGRGDIDWWVVHPGGTAVLTQFARQMKLSDEALRFSHAVFAQYGNMSSPSVLFVLREILDRGRPEPGQKAILVAFGAGFSAFATLIEFGPG